MSAPDLGRLADLLMAHVTDLDVLGAALFPFRADDIDEPDLAALRIPLLGHPVDHLRSYRPPTGCVALGLVCGGWAAPIDSPVRPSAHPDAQRIVQASVLGRDGELVGRVRYPDRRVIDTGRGGYGRVPDAMRRALRRAA